MERVLGVVSGEGWGGGGSVNVFVPTEGTMSVFGTKDEREEGRQRTATLVLLRQQSRAVPV